MERYKWKAKKAFYRYKNIYNSTVGPSFNILGQLIHHIASGTVRKCLLFNMIIMGVT